MVAPAPQHMLRWCGQPFALVQPHSWGQGRDSLLPLSRPLASSFLRLSPARCSQPTAGSPRSHQCTLALLSLGWGLGLAAVPLAGLWL